MIWQPVRSQQTESIDGARSCIEQSINVSRHWKITCDSDTKDPKVTKYIFNSIELKSIEIATILSGHPNYFSSQRGTTYKVTRAIASSRCCGWSPESRVHGCGHFWFRHRLTSKALDDFHHEGIHEVCRWPVNAVEGITKLVYGIVRLITDSQLKTNETNNSSSTHLTSNMHTTEKLKSIKE